MIYITADTHGESDRLSGKRVKALKKFDTLIVLGDFCYLWEGDNLQKNLRKISKLPFRILFIDGYYDDMSIIEKYPDTVYRGAKAKEIIPGKLYYIKRGEIIQTDDMKILCFGGDDDLFDDVFGQRPPGDADFENCLKNIEIAGGEVDYILTHSPSGRTDRFLNLESRNYGNLFSFFDILADKVKYKKWYFGYYHRDKYISVRSQAVYENLYRLGE